MDEALSLLQRLQHMLDLARDEQYREYWRFTRSRNAAPVSPAITTEVVWLEQQVIALRSWVRECQAVTA